MAKELLFSVVCPTCEAKIGVHDKRLIGQLVQCPKCGSIVQLTPSEKDVKSLKPSESEEKESEEKKEFSPSLHSGNNTQPITKKEDRNTESLPSHIPESVPPKSTVPVPPPVAIPVPPPAPIPEPMSPDDLMPEPMSRGTLKSNSPQNGKSIFQQLNGLSDRLTSWMPYLIIGIGVIVLLSLLFLFLWGGSKQGTSETKNNNNNPVAKNNNNKEYEQDKKLENSTKFNKNEKNGDEESDSINKSYVDNKKSEDNINNELSEENTADNKSVENNEQKQEDSTSLVDNSPVEDNSLQVVSDENVAKDSDVSKPSEKSENTEDNEEELELDKSSPLNEDENNTSFIQDNKNRENDDTLEKILDDTNIENTPNKINEDDSKNSEDKKPLIPGLDVKLKSISIRELKLSQCLQTLRELGALPIEINWDSLRRNGVSADDKISWSGKDVTVQSVLTEVLSQRGLMFKINEEEKIVFVPRVSINARSDSGDRLSVVSGSAMVRTQYSVSDLVGRSPEKTAELIRSIREFLCPGDWKEVGGTGAIAAAGGGSIVITQSQQNQWIIADFLDRLRLARHLAPLHNRDVSLDLMSVRAQSALKRNVGINFQPTADLKTALSEIGQRIGVSILLDEPSLKIAGISAQFPISFDARVLSLEETFNRINEETGLVYLAQTPNSFIVTTPEGAKSMMSVEFYPISDLVNIGLTPTVLMEQIVKFEPKSWKSQDAASFGLVDYDANSDCLIVRQSPSVLSKISELLTQLRARLKAKE